MARGGEHVDIGAWPPTVIATPRRYVALDGMRGIAAFVVILFHTSSIAPIAPHGPHFGFLAVDLFFALSGFVLAYSYDRQFARGMKPGEFMRRRFVRLYPLFVLGLFVGFVLRTIPAFRDTTGGPLTGHEILVAAVFNAFMLPAPNSAQNHLIFPTDVPAWSLFFEVWVANLAFAFLWKQLQGRGLAAFISVMALLCLVSEAVFHTWNVGYQWNTFAGGFVRVSFSFAIGVAAARVHAARPPRLHMPSWVIWITVLSLMFVPLSRMLGEAYELLCVFVFIPALIYFGAEAVDRRPVVGLALGEASYAAYAIHVPLLSLLCYLAPSAIAHPSELYGVGFATAVFCLSLALAYFYDKPVRDALERIFRPAPPGASPSPPSRQASGR